MSQWRSKSLWSIASRFLGAGLSFLLNVQLARAMAQDDVGLFFLSLSISWGGSLLCQWGSSTLAVKWIAQARSTGDISKVASLSWSLILFTTLHSILFGAVILSLDLPPDITALWALWILSIGLQNLMPEILRGFDDLKWASLLSAPIPQGMSVAMVALYAWTSGNLSFGVSASLVITANFISVLIGVVILVSRAGISLRLSNYRAFLVESSPIAMSLAATYLLSQGDLWVCSFLFENSDIAYYGVGQRFVTFVSMPMMILGSVMTPTLASLSASRSWTEIEAVVQRGVRRSGLAALLVYCVGVIIGFPVIRMLFGEGYTSAYLVFVVLGGGQLLHALAGPNGYLLLMGGQQRAAMRATITSALLLFPLTWLGGKFFGVYGIALGSMLALTFQTIWMWVSVRRHFGIELHLKLKKIKGSTT